MRTVTKIETADGALHDSIAAATRHAENRYRLALSALAHRLVRLDSYSTMLDHLDKPDTAAAFAELAALKADCAEPENDGRFCAACCRDMASD
jgi:hypothetical protein